jgi:hypothetical protein
MLKLNNRAKSIPNGLQFHIPQLPNFKLPPQCSFAVAVDSIVAVRKANPYLAHKLGWKTDQVSVENELDFFNASICAAQNWTSYIATEGQGAPPVPKPLAAQHKASGAIAAAANTAKKLWAGLRSTNDWIDSGLPAVPQSQSEARAAVCVACPLNGKGGIESFFTVPASEAIKRQIQKLETRKLATSLDEKLGVCTACLCPLPLLVQTPLQFKLAHMTPDTRAALDKSCWVTREEKEQKT